MDLKLGTNNDLLFINGACPVTEDRAESVAQRLQIRLRTFQGEWFLRDMYGVPYLTVLGKRVKKSTIDLMMQEQIYKETGVVQIVSFTSTLGRDRKYECRFKVKVSDGSTTGMIEIP